MFFFLLFDFLTLHFCQHFQVKCCNFILSIQYHEFVVLNPPPPPLIRLYCSFCYPFLSPSSELVKLCLLEYARNFMCFLMRNNVIKSPEDMKYDLLVNYYTRPIMHILHDGFHQRFKIALSTRVRLKHTGTNHCFVSMNKKS